MRKYRLMPAFITLVLALSFVLNACSQTGAPTAEPAVNLKIAVLPVLDVLPMYVADQEGLFEKHNLNVEFVPAGSAPERDQLIASGQVDGMINEIVSTIFYNKEEAQVQIVRIARAATSETALFSILAAKDSAIQNVEDLKNTQIGVSQGTVIEYLTERLLQAEGFSPDEIETVAVPKIDDRMALLGTGQLKAGMLPEPLSSLAVLNGARLILDDTQHPEYSSSMITFRKAVIDEHPEAIRAFLAAYEEAVSQINAEPSKWEDVMIENNLLPEPLVGLFQVPQFVTASVPNQEQWNDALAWTQEKGLIDQNVSYASSVTSEFLP
ncbi:MAG: MetQ/NlpA family ABC transporter substrate-binding protein [Anaerolineales bacterium]|jgi:NitT/TauT family transport system substrate-binding protein